MKEQKLRDHLLRHQDGKMVSMVTRIFGVQHLEMWSFVENPKEVIPMIKKTDDWSSGAIEFAVVK